ncbi:hypothetical protein D3C78_744340 [compost metagenome]
MRAAHHLAITHQQPKDDAECDKAPGQTRTLAPERKKQPRHHKTAGRVPAGETTAGAAINRCVAEQGIRNRFSAVFHQIPRAAVMAHAFQDANHQRAEPHQ